MGPSGWPPDNVDIPEGPRGGEGSENSNSEVGTLGFRGVGGEVEDVPISRMVHGEEEAEEPPRVATAPGEEVGEGWKVLGPAAEVGRRGVMGEESRRGGEAGEGGEEEEEGDEGDRNEGEEPLLGGP